jgi:peroxiredoxin
MCRSWAAAPCSTFTRVPASPASIYRRAGTIFPARAAATPQSCSFRDHFAELKALGVAHVFGLSTQDTDYQREAAERLHLPFPLLSDAELKFTRALDLPTFTVAGMTLLKRMVLIVDDGVIGKVFYPVFPPDKSAADVVAFLRQSSR